MKTMLGAAIAAGMLALTPAAQAQQTSTRAPSLLVDTSENVPRFGRANEHAVGMRAWVFIMPSWMVGLFANVNPGWSGATNLAIGPEYTLRRGGLDVVLSLQYTGFQADSGYFRGKSESDVATERVQSSLWGLYANALFLWHHRFNDWFELQYGAGVGLGYVGGDLYRTQVYPGSAGGYNDCTGQGSPRSDYCDFANQHYNGYREGRLTDTNSGSIPPVIPWISLPHLAAHFRPHRNVDVRLDGGFALIGFYTGLAAHYVF